MKAERKQGNLDWTLFLFPPSTTPARTHHQQRRAMAERERERENGNGLGGASAEWSSAWNMGSMDGLNSTVKSENSAASRSSSSNNPTTPSISKAPTKHLLLSPGAGPGAAASIAAHAPSSASASMQQQQQQLQGASSSSSTASNAGHAAASSPAPSSAAATAGGPSASINENDKVYWLIVELLSPQTREAALLELSKKREQWDDLALVLWHSFGGSQSTLVSPACADLLHYLHLVYADPY
jgi:hypothetical protein